MAQVPHPPGCPAQASPAQAVQEGPWEMLALPLGSAPMLDRVEGEGVWTRAPQDPTLPWLG